MFCGETEDNTIADLAVALNVVRIETGSARSDRMAVQSATGLKKN
jgi:enolase